MNRSVNPGFDRARACIVRNPAQYESLLCPKLPKTLENELEMCYNATI